MLYKIPPLSKVKNNKVPPPIGSHLKQYQIGFGGTISLPKSRHLLTDINTIESP